MGFHSESIRFEGWRETYIGLKRTGKSCRLRWVNYLQPGLKRGKMTPHEERLVLELHAKYGNRWSRIAQKLPGRTDNEIKNYWRTQMRKKGHQERKKAISIAPSPSSSSSNSSYSSSISNSPSAVELSHFTDLGFYNTGEFDTLTASGDKKSGLEVESTKIYSMDEIWKDIEMSERSSNSAIMPSPLWDFSPSTTTGQSLWSSTVHEEEVLMHQMDDHFLYSIPFCNHHMNI